jgi:DNA-directed RNA polymerase subunit RPC12/RpoP
MSKTKIKEQIFEVEKAIVNFPKYEKILRFHKKILEILLPLDESMESLVKIDLNKKTFECFLDEIIASKNSLNKLIKKSDFDRIIVMNTVKKIIQILLDNNANGDELRVFREYIEENEVVINDAISSILEEDPKWFESRSKKFGIEPSLLLLIFESPLRPFFEKVSRELEEEIKEIWLKSYCPICGRQSNVARKKKNKRYMVCPYCGLEYLVDMFECINCGNIDPTRMGFIKIKENKEYELNYCRVCNHYIKILDEDLATVKIPYGLEDLLTRDLDSIASSSDFNLKRI